MVWAPVGGLSNGAGRAVAGRGRGRARQIGLVSTRRMKAAPLSQQSSASSARAGRRPSGPTSTSVDDEPDERGGGRPWPGGGGSRRRGCSSAPSDRPPALERPDQGHLVGVLEVAADRQAAGDPGDRRRRPSSSRSARYIAVASPSSVGFVARITSSNGVPSRARRRRRARAARGSCRRSGPIPSIGEIAPWRTW